MSVATEQDDASPAQNQIDNHQTPPEYRRTNFTRSHSIEKIIKFNAYICSQNFFILPSILTWLRTSQTVLKSYAEKYIIPIKSTVYNAILYNAIETFRIVTTILKAVSLSDPHRILPAIKTVFAELSTKLENLPEKLKRKILKATVYFCFFYIFLQLSLCMWTLSGGIIPGGLIFMLVCLTAISYGNFQCLRFVIIKEILKAEAKICNTNTSRRKYVKPRDIMGKRTISNINLF